MPSAMARAPEMAQGASGPAERAWRTALPPVSCNMYDRPYQSWRSPSIARNRSACDQLVWSSWSPERTRACFARFVCKGISLFSLVPLAPNLAPDWSFAEELKKEAGSERTVGPVQTFFFRAEEPALVARSHGSLGRSRYGRSPVA